MREICGTLFQSLDGVMQAPGSREEDPTGGFDLGGWQFGFPDEEAGEAIGASLAPPYALLLGRRTYDIFAAYWPFHEGEDKSIADAFNAAEKYVLTTSDAPLDWANSHRLRGFDDLAALRDGDGPRLQIWGSSTLYPGLIERGLLDRLSLLTYPLILGKGKRSFPGGTPPATLRFESGRTTSKGTAVATFVPTPGVALGSSPPNSPNPREQARQAAIKENRW
ncbi:dihydrofolate reductase family protein [Sphingomonas sp. ASV193]|uniref:dihydrofolate reductase family protein n=1 Tax=Sphingomonas sp. ASV193 TaxID=3144405 RepID=UPI0032E8FA0D